MRQLLYILALLPLSLSGQYTGIVYNGPWSQGRVDAERINHVVFSFEAPAGASGYVIEHKMIDDGFGYYEPSKNLTGFSVLSQDCTNNTPAGGANSPTYCISGTTVTAYGLQNGKRHIFRWKSTGATNADFNNIYSNHLITRTGLFPIETTTYDNTPWINIRRATEPGPGDFSWWDNPFGQRERKITDRVRDGNDRGASMGYPKQERVLEIGPEGSRKQYLRPHEFGSNRLTLRVDDDSYDLVDIFFETYVPLNVQAANDTIFWDDEGGNEAVNTVVKYTNGSGNTVYSSSPRVSGNGTSGIMRSGENRFSWDMKYFAVETYAVGSSDPYSDQPQGIVYDIEADAVERTFTPPPGFLIGNGQFDVCPKGDCAMFNNDQGSGTGAAIHVYDRATGAYLGNFENNTAGGTGNGDYTGHADLGISQQGNCGIVGRKGGNLVFAPFRGPRAGQTLNLIEVSSAIRKPENAHIGTNWYLHQGWVLVDTGTNGGHPGTSGDFNMYYNKIWAVAIDESADERNVNAMARFYAIGHATGTKSTGGNRVTNHYANATPDMEKVFFNAFTPRNGSTNHAEAYVVERNTLHGDEIPFTAGGGDVTPPTVTNVVIDQITQTSARITWDLDEGATGQLEYGLTTGYGTTSVADSSFRDRHIQTIGAGINLPNLMSGTLYNLNILGQDAAGNAIAAFNRTFTTLAADVGGIRFNSLLLASARGSGGSVKFIVN
ncbi:fibronectin type III domain-containing protein [Robiginitalea biformata]|uniref:Fibronectin type-III domain-containing protein n=1 Tax=Robiginitalea biformata (strain ATCC BAA-864 / DSM 15991 / KCTC 12146 / HTCC2501) TaxID=313596 RepID=A4CKP8_ROBBH|nr:fibronectin type III domain-containing protein [Robiginitalea biformata]EAR15447.1 hypothetical protein RB2501_14004 [Robiginitalea biformata HTCC2501]